MGIRVALSRVPSSRRPLGQLAGDPPWAQRSEGWQAGARDAGAEFTEGPDTRVHIVIGTVGGETQESDAYDGNGAGAVLRCERAMDPGGLGDWR